MLRNFVDKALRKLHQFFLVLNNCEFTRDYLKGITLFGTNTIYNIIIHLSLEDKSSGKILGFKNVFIFIRPVFILVMFPSNRFNINALCINRSTDPHHSQIPVKFKGILQI